jgi:hypothetical protein
MRPIPDPFSSVPDVNFLTLMKAIKECPRTARELEKKTLRNRAPKAIIR